MINKLLITPFQKFTNVESFSGLLLFAATAIALIWANSPFAETYHAIWQNKISIDIPGFELSKPLILWINDGLMALFFFVIGLEIKRELMIGELDSLKKASLPIFAALGGMIVPVAVYFLLNKNPDTAGGWGISLATDIAFALAVLKLLGKRVPASLLVFLTAFAIVDDIGAVMVIAIFYSANIAWNLIIIALVLLAVLFYLAHKGIYAKYILALFGIVIWVLFLKSGIHPTIAGVLLAFSVPIRQKIETEEYLNEINDIANKIKLNKKEGVPVLSKEQIHAIDDLESWTDKLQSPLQHLEHKMHSWVAYFIMPVFALANAGVSFTSDMIINTTLASTIAISLVAGKAIGVFSFSYLSVKVKLASLPSDLNFKLIFGASVLAGLGFTMAIFIANLAFKSDPALIDSAKIGIIIASIAAGVLGYAILRFSNIKNKNEFK